MKFMHNGGVMTLCKPFQVKIKQNHRTIKIFRQKNGLARKSNENNSFCDPEAKTTAMKSHETNNGKNVDNSTKKTNLRR